MSQMRLTLIGLYNYDPTLFDQMVMPDGVDSDLVKNTILQRSGEFELLYTGLDFMKNMIGFWSNKHLRTFTKWNDALNIKYDPLYNYDRTEEISIGRTGSDSRSGSNNMTESDYKIGNTTSETDGTTTPPETTSTKTSTVAAYDSSTYQPKEQSTDSIAVNTIGSDSTDSSGSYDESSTRNESSSHKELADRTENETHSARIFGNIGVTTSQMMLQSEIDVARFNLYEQIADMFADEFCIMIY